MELKMIKLNEILTNPLQPRQDFDREKLQELANSIKEGELLQPIVVRGYNEKYEIVAGERRYKAFQILKEPKIPCIVRDIKDDTDALEKSLIENLQRDDLTSVERENAIGQLSDSKRYKNDRELSKKLGISEQVVYNILSARESRKTIGTIVSTSTLTETAGLSDEPRKKILKAVENKKIEPSKVRDVVRKVKEFPEPEQQMEILEEFEQQEETSKEIFDDIVQKKKEIAFGEREPEHIIEIESDADKRLISDYKDIKFRLMDVQSDHIEHMKNENKKKDAIKIVWDMFYFLERQLKNLGEIKVVNDEEEKESSTKS